MVNQPEWYYRQSAAIPYLEDREGIQIVLITNRSQSDWIYPKGIVEYDMTPAQSAANEALEEAGVIGVADDLLLDEYTYEKWDGLCHVEVFPMFVTEILEDWDEKGMRDRKFVELEKAIQEIKPVQKNGLLKLKSYLEVRNS